MWLGLGKAFRKQVRLYCNFKDRCYIPSQSAREGPGSLNKEKKIERACVGDQEDTDLERKKGSLEADTGNGVAKV